jgi:hypothetical protein
VLGRQVLLRRRPAVSRHAVRVFEYPADGPPQGRKKQLIFEQRDWSPYVQEGYENGAAFYGTKGMLIIGHTVGWRLYGPRNKLIAERSGSADLAAHHHNFFDCIRGKEKQLNADITAGHRSATIVHLANIAARWGACCTSIRRPTRSPTGPRQRMREKSCASLATVAPIEQTFRSMGRRDYPA